MCLCQCFCKNFNSCIFGDLVFFLPNIHLQYELTKTHPFIAKNTVTVLLLVVKMPRTQYKIKNRIISFLFFLAMLHSCHKTDHPILYSFGGWALTFSCQI